MATRRAAAAHLALAPQLLLLLVGGMWRAPPFHVAAASHPRANGRPHHRSHGPAPAPVAWDVLVYGSTPGAVMSAVAAARRGSRTVLVDPAARVGGMCSGGLGQTDKGNPVVIGGLAREFFTRNRQQCVAPTRAVLPAGASCDCPG